MQNGPTGGGRPTAGANRSGGGGGGVTSVVGVDGIVVTNGTGPVVTVGQRLEAQWTIGIMRIYAVDRVNGNDANRGYADPADNTQAGYQAACVAAGLVAKKTVAGLAAIFPRVGNGRITEIQFAPGTYVGSPADFLNGTSGYVSGCPIVRGTGTVASAGSVAFDGSLADATAVGGATATGLNAAGYTPAGSISTTSIECTKVGGAAPAFAATPALPLGVRIRFDHAAPTQAALRNECRQVSRVPASDTVQVQSAEVALPIAGDVFYTEQPGVIFGNCALQDLDPGSGVTLVGLTFNSLQVRSGRAFIAFCTSTSFFGDSLDGAEFGQFYNHPIYGFVTVGGGLRVTSTATLGGGVWICQGLVSTSQTTFLKSNDIFWAAGCAARNLIVLDAIIAQSDDNQQSPAIGTAASETEGIPFTFGAASGAGVNLNGCTLMVGNLDIVGAGGSPALRIRGRCNLVFVGTVTGTTGNTDVGCDFQNSTLSTVELRNGKLPTVAGAAGEVRWCGQALDVWSRFNFEEAYDIGGNRVYLGDVNASYRHTIDPTVTLGVNNNGSALTAFTLVRSNGTNLQAAAATAALISDTEGLYGVLVNAPTNGAACLVNGFSGIKLINFDTPPAVGKMAFVSDTAGLATTTPPSIRIPIGIVVGNSFPGNLGLVRLSYQDPVFASTDTTLEARFKARWLSLAPDAYSMFQFDDMDYRINLATDDQAADWDYANGAVRTADFPTCAKCAGTGADSRVQVNRNHQLSIDNQRTKDWMMSGAMYFTSDLDPTDDWRALTIVGNPNIYDFYVSVGVHQFVDTGFFSFSIKAGATINVSSTVAFATGWHRLEVWYDASATTLFGSIDGETPIALTTNASDIPDGDLFQWHGSVSGATTVYVDAVCTANVRP